VDGPDKPGYGGKPAPPARVSETDAANAQPRRGGERPGPRCVGKDFVAKAIVGDNSEVDLGPLAFNRSPAQPVIAPIGVMFSRAVSKGGRRRFSFRDSH